MARGAYVAPVPLHREYTSANDPAATETTPAELAAVIAKSACHDVLAARLGPTSGQHLFDESEDLTTGALVGAGIRGTQQPRHL